MKHPATVGSWLLVGLSTGARIASAAIVPSNVPADVCGAAQGESLDVATGTVTIDTGSALNCDRILSQSPDPDLCVEEVDDVTVAPGATLRVIGFRLLVLVARNSMNVFGTIDLSADGTVSGPGAPSGAGAGVVSSTTSAGSGGAGHGSAGGVGGAAGSAGGTAGPSFGLAELVPLLPGAKGGNSNDGGAHGGGGGGALQLVACSTALLAASSIVDGGGGGGEGGLGSANGSLPANGGAGGGSGGSVLIEADSLTVAGLVSANGGGGGGGGMKGSSGAGANGSPGIDGARSSLGALGGPAGGIGAGNGGNGGALASTPGTGGSSAANGAGGGGGAVGRIRLGYCNSLSAAGALISPAPTQGSRCNVLLASGFEDGFTGWVPPS